MDMFNKFPSPREGAGYSGAKFSYVIGTNIPHVNKAMNSEK